MKKVKQWATAGVAAAMAVSLSACGGNKSANESAPVAAVTDSVPAGEYIPLNVEDPIEFAGTNITYQGITIPLGPKAIYLDGSLADETAGRYDYVYNDITEALSAQTLTNGTEQEPMTVYIAPYVYWIDDPEASDTLEKTEGYEVPYGMVVDCEWLSLKGLTQDPDHVVLAGNRGQSHGADGNYTMFRFNNNGTGLQVQNLTIGNYCNVNLDYALKPELNHEKRTSTITQAQLADLSGDRMFAENCNFISRLNLRPINGGERSLYNNCHFESTDDAINGNAVFVGCDFDFYGNRPLAEATKTGSVFLDCTFWCVTLTVETEPVQYFTKRGGAIAAVDCTYQSNFNIPFEIAWTKYPESSLKCYQYNILHNGKPITIAGEGAQETVDMTDTEVLKAYRIESDGKSYYNTYNLLRGNDQWDPLDVKASVTAAGADKIPTMLTLETTEDIIVSGSNEAVISSKVLYFYQTEETGSAVTYTISEKDGAYATLTDHGNGTCTIQGINDKDETKQVMVHAKTPEGLEASLELTVKPSVLEPPSFTKKLTVQKEKEGYLTAEYDLDLGDREDQSVISWYRSQDAAGSSPILVAVSTQDQPKYEYRLTAGDIGSYLTAKVEPKHIRSNPGSAVSAMFPDKITAANVTAHNFHTDFSDFPVVRQTEIKPGYWTVDTFQPADMKDYSGWKGEDTNQPWIYGQTGDGSVGMGIYQGTQGVRLMYTPVAGTYGSMSFKLLADPAKIAGQGFGSAGQYMDLCIKFDTETLTGYGLRIIRTEAASNACTFVLVRYEKGQISYISDEVLSSCYLTGCEITMKAEGTKLTAHVETQTPQLADQAKDGYIHSVDLNGEITESGFGGVSLLHTGTTGSGGWQNTTMLHELDVEWLGENPQNP